MQVQVAGEKEAFAEVTPHALVRFPDRRKIDLLIPAKQQLKISKGLSKLAGRKAESKGLKQRPEAWFIKHGKSWYPPGYDQPCGGQRRGPTPNLILSLPWVW